MRKRSKEDQDLFRYACLKVFKVGKKKHLLTRAIIYFTDPELGTIYVGHNKGSAESVVTFMTVNGYPQHVHLKSKL